MRRDRRLARSVLSRMIHVAVDGTTRAAIDIWRDQAFDMRRHEAVLDRTRRRWLHRTATKSFERWREYVLVRKHVKTVALHVLQRLAHSNAAPAFIQWRDQTRRLAHCDHLVGSALARMRHACAARAFVGWVHRWEESKRRTDLLTHIVLKLLHAKLAPGFRKLVAWALDYDRRALARERTDRLLRRVVAVFEHTRINEGLNGWKRFTSLRREAEEKQVRQGVILDRCRRRLRHSLLGRSYNQWVFYKRDRKRLRTLARRIVKQFYNNETWPALNTWKAFVVRQRSLERLMHKVIGQLQHRLSSKSWRTWTTTVRRAVRYETIIDRSRRKWLYHAQAKALTAWCFMVSERQRLRNLVKKAFYRMRASKLGRGFRAWARIVEAGRTMNVRDAAASARTAARYWFDAAELRSEHVLRRNAFGAFKQLRRRRAQNRLRAARWARALKRRRTRGVFENWRRYGKLRMLQVPGKLRAALRVAHDECARQLRRGFSIWLHGVDVARLEEARKAAQGASRLQRLDKALVAIEYTQYQLVRKVFVAWTDVFLHRKRSGRLTSFVGVALARATMIKAYHAWGRYVESHRRVRRTLKTLSTRKHATNCFRAFGRWHAYSASLPAVGADFVAGFAVPPPPCDDSDEDVTLTPPPPPSGLFSSGPSYASTPTAAQPYFDDDPAAGATLYESPVGRAVEY